jgi:vacuolar protein sorting-associated protein 35
VKEALLLYEGEISDSKVQVRTLTSVIGALLNCRNFSSEDYEALITKVAQYANKLLKKPDQCRMVTLCSHLFYRKNYDGSVVSASAEGGSASGHYSDPDRSLECMQRALKIASVSNPNLFVEILDRFVME